MVIMKKDTVRETIERISRQAQADTRKRIAQQIAEKRKQQISIEEIEKRLEDPSVQKIYFDKANLLCGDVYENVNDLLVKFLTVIKQEQATQNLTPIIYPEGCRFFHRNPDGRGIAVVEQSPQYRTIQCDNNRYHLPMPYVVFVVHFRPQKNGIYIYNGIRVGFRNKPLKNLDEIMYSPSLPNFGGTSVCMGQHTCHGTPCSIVEYTIGKFWQSTFAGWGTIPQNFSYKNKQIHNWREWEAIPLLNILDAKFQYQKRNTIRYHFQENIAYSDNDIDFRNSVISAWDKAFVEMRKNAEETIADTTTQILKTVLTPKKPRKSALQSRKVK